MLQTIWHHFSVQFLLLFQMVCYILLAVLPFTTPIADGWKTFNSQSGSTKRIVSKWNTESKMEHTIWKSNENGAYTWCQIVCSILFDLFLCMTSSVVSLFLWSYGSKARGESRALEGCRVRSKRPSRVRNRHKGVAGRKRIAFPRLEVIDLSPGK